MIIKTIWLPWDDGLTPLPQYTRSKDNIELVLKVKAPPDPGSYYLEIDLVQIGIAWFGIKGSKTVKIPVKVKGIFKRNDKIVPKMEMYCIPKDEIIELIGSNGGKLIDLLDTSWADMNSYRYIVTK